MRTLSAPLTGTLTSWNSLAYTVGGPLSQFDSLWDVVVYDFWYPNPIPSPVSSLVCPISLLRPLFLSSFATTMNSIGDPLPPFFFNFRVTAFSPPLHLSLPCLLPRVFYLTCHCFQPGPFVSSFYSNGIFSSGVPPASSIRHSSSDLLPGDNPLCFYRLYAIER